MKTVHILFILFLVIIFGCQKEENNSCDLKIVSQRQQDISDLYLSPNPMRWNKKRIMDENFREYFLENINHIFDTLNTKTFSFKYEYFIEKDTTECVLAKINYTLKLGQINYNKEKYWMPLKSESTCFANDEKYFFDAFIEIQTINFDKEGSLNIYPIIKWGLGLKSNYHPRRNDRDILIGLSGSKSNDTIHLYIASNTNSFYFSIPFSSIPRSELTDFIDTGFKQKIYQKIFNTNNNVKERAKGFLDGVSVMINAFEEK